MRFVNKTLCAFDLVLGDGLILETDYRRKTIHEDTRSKLLIRSVRVVSWIILAQAEKSTNAKSDH